MSREQLCTCITLFSIFPHDDYTKPPDATFYVGRDLGVKETRYFNTLCII